MVQPLSSPTMNYVAKIEGTRIAKMAKMKNWVAAITIRRSSILSN
jgi:hypothetical protein